MNTNKVQIHLDNNTRVYYPGQNVSGNIECFFGEGENIRFVKIQFKGLASTQWNEDETYYDDTLREEKTRTVTYNDEEVYFNSEYNLFQNTSENVSFGRKTLPFSQMLPLQIPSSFEGLYGSVKYFIKVIIDYAWKSSDISVLNLKIIAPLDLNTMPELSKPAASSVDKTPCSCWCQNSGPITLNTSLPVTGFVPGQEVNVGVYVENLSNVFAESVSFAIVRHVKYQVNLPYRTKDSEDMIAVCHERGIGAHGDKSWTSTLLIPESGDYPNLLACNLIKITYHLKETLVLPLPHTNLVDEIRLVIGTVPLSGVNINPPGVPRANEATAPPFEDNVSTRDINIDKNLRPPHIGWSLSGEGSENLKFIDAPPSYEEAGILDGK